MFGRGGGVVSNPGRFQREHGHAPLLEAFPFRAERASFSEPQPVRCKAEDCMKRKQNNRF